MGLKDMLASRSQIQAGIASTTAEDPTNPNFDPTAQVSAENAATNTPSSPESNGDANVGAVDPVAGLTQDLMDEELLSAMQLGLPKPIDCEQPVRFAQYHIRRIQDRGWHYPVDGYFYAKNERQLATLKLLNKEGHVVAENYTPTE